MASNVTVTDSDLQALKGPALTAFDEAVERYRADLFAEASRLEAALNSAGRAPEITSSMVQDADLLMRRGYAKRPKSGWLMLCKIGSAIGGFVTGILADADKLKDPQTLVTFIVVLSTTIVATVVSAMKE